MKKIKKIIYFVIITLFIFENKHQIDASSKISHNDTQRSIIQLTSEVISYLDTNFKNMTIPSIKKLNPDMTKNYYKKSILKKATKRNHPSYINGDFNNDGLTDHALLLTSKDTKDVEFIILNSTLKSNNYNLYQIKPPQNFYTSNQYENSFLLFEDNIIYNGTFQKNGYYILWSPEENNYIVRYQQ